MSSALREFGERFVSNIVLFVGGVLACVVVAAAGTAILMAPMFLGIYAKYGDVAAVYEAKVLGGTLGPIVAVVNVVWILIAFAAFFAFVSVVEDHD